jgi:hypothetical protein
MQQQEGYKRHQARRIACLLLQDPHMADNKGTKDSSAIRSSTSDQHVGSASQSRCSYLLAAHHAQHVCASISRADAFQHAAAHPPSC